MLFYTWFFFFFFNDTATTEIYTLSLHDALPILFREIADYNFNALGFALVRKDARQKAGAGTRSEEHTSELQSQSNLVCRLLLEKKKKNTTRYIREMSTAIDDLHLLV